MSVLQIVFSLLGTIVFVVLVLASMKPNEFRIARSISINAPAEAVFAQLADFHLWNNWSPWDKMDPSMNRTYEGAASGEGAVYAWNGNKKVGSGRMEITEAVAPHRVSIQLDFITPFEAHNKTEFNVEASNGVTNVTWAMTGKNNFMSKIMNVVMNMDKLVGADFERGLTALKGIAEAK